MSKKLSELPQQEKRIIENELNSLSNNLGMEPYDSYSSNSYNSLKDLIGMCYNCKNLNYCKTEFGSVHAFCCEFEFKLSGQNRIVECNSHSPKGVLSLSEMYEIAYIIESNEEKVEGFISKNPKFKK